MPSNKSLSRNTFINTVCTLASRVFGLARDIVLSWYWGCTEAPQAAFNIAFAIPNMLRMLFGEGAFSAAFVPMLTDKLKEGRKEEAEQLASRTISLQCLFLTIIVLLGTLASSIIYHYLPQDAPERVELLFRILPLLLPYAIFICMAGAYSSILHCLSRFAIPSLNPVLFNIIQIAAIFILYFMGSTRQEFNSLLFFCASVFVAGIVQMLILFFVCRHNGFDIKFLPLWKNINGTRVMLWNDREVKTLCSRIAPGLIGAGVFQLNALLDKSLAVYLGSVAVGSLAYCQHLVYLPIGIFGVAMSLVCQPQMARASESEKGECLDYALRQVLFMTLPCTALLAVLSEPTITVLFQRGAFNAEAVKETVWALWFLLPGLPAFCAVKIAVTTHNGRGDTKTPAKVSMFCIILNLVLNLSLMHVLRQGGLALATAICSWVNLIILLTIDAHKLPNWNWRRTVKGVLRLAAAAIVAALVTWLPALLLPRFFPAMGYFLKALTVLVISGCIGTTAYLVSCRIFRAPELADFLASLQKK